FKRTMARVEAAISGPAVGGSAGRVPVYVGGHWPGRAGRGTTLLVDLMDRGDVHVGGRSGSPVLGGNVAGADRQKCRAGSGRESGTGAGRAMDWLRGGSFANRALGVRTPSEPKLEVF